MLNQNWRPTMDINGITDVIKVISPIAATLAGAVVSVMKTKDAVGNLVNSKPLLRKAIKADLDLLKLMNKNDPGHKLLTDHIKKQVEALIREDKKKEIVIKDWLRIVFGLSMAGGSGYWTYYIIKDQNTSNWWMILSVWIALAGLGVLIGAIEKPAPNDASKPGPNDASKPGPNDASKPGPNDASKED